MPTSTIPNPKSTASIAGHPLHPMLIPFPIATSGFIFRLAGHSLAFVIFAAFAGVTTILAWLLLPETKPASYID